MSYPVFIFTCLYLSFIIIANQLGFYSSNIPKNIVSQEVALTGIVDNIPESDEEKTVFVLRVSSGSVVPQNNRVLARCYFPQVSFAQGDILQIKGRLSLPNRAKNPGEFDYQKYLVRKKIYTILWVYDEKNIKKIGKKPVFIVLRWSNLLREKILGIINKNLPAEESSVLAGLLIGDKTGLTDEIQKTFIDAGVMHVLVVSGANVGFIVALFYWLFRNVLRLRKDICWILSIPIIIIYALITGSNPPVVRASIMAIVFILTYLLQRNVSVYQSLLLSFLVILLFEPLILFDIGFQLSFTATFGIIFLMSKLIPSIKSLPRILFAVISISLVSVSAQLFVNPVMAYYFHRLSLVAIISNLIIVPLIAVISWSGFGLFFAAPVGGIVSDIIVQVNYWLLHWLIHTVNVFAQWKYATIFVPQPGPIFLVWYYFTLIFVWKLKSKRNVVMFVCGQMLFVFLFLFSTITAQNKTRITFLSVGQGDSVFVELPGRKTVLIDGGGNLQSNYDVGERIIAPFLLTRGYTHIDKLILTHWHYNHYLGLIKIVKDFKVNEFCVGAMTDMDNELIRLIEEKKINHGLATAGHKWIFSNTKFEIFNPVLAANEDVDDNSLVTKISTDRFSVLLCGDIGQDAQNKISSLKLESTCLLIPNHGKEKISQKFLDSVNPKIAVISGDRSNKNVTSQLQPAGIRVFTTKDCGAITMDINDKGYTIKPFRLD